MGFASKDMQFVKVHSAVQHKWSHDMPVHYKNVTAVFRLSPQDRGCWVAPLL